MLPSRLRTTTGTNTQSRVPSRKARTKTLGATRSTFQKAHLCLSSSYAFECDSRDQCLKSKSFFLSQLKSQVKNKTVCQYQSTSSSLHWLAFVFVSNYKNVNLRICTSTSLRVSYWNEFGRTKEFWKSFYETLDCASSCSSCFCLHAAFRIYTRFPDHAEKKSRRRSPRTTKSIIIPKLPISVLVKICLHVSFRPKMWSWDQLQVPACWRQNSWVMLSG